MCNRTVLWDCLIDDLWSSLPPGIRRDYLVNGDVDGGDLAECSNERNVAALLLARSIFKKFQDEIDQEAADKAAFDLLLQVNTACKNMQFIDSKLGPFDELVIGEFKQGLWDFFNPEGQPLLSQSAIERHADFGPGSAPGAADETFLTKIGHSQLSGTSPLILSFFDQWCRSHPSRLSAELARTLLHGSPKIAEPVKISAVPKTSKISRLVKPEPLLNMFFQKGVQQVLEDRLFSYFGIDLSKQPAFNAKLAYIGSITGEYATIDLKSASDHLSMKLLECFLDRQNLFWFKLLRSESAVVPSSGVIDLHMVATMGNAFCFPLQTIVFACAVRAVYRSLGISFTKAFSRVTTWTEESLKAFLIQEDLPTNFGVFGDDIVVRHDAVGTLKRLLDYLGFVVNEDKSFCDEHGPFRESCGSDFWAGHNVRGVYCKSLKTPQDRFSLINNLIAWSIRHDLPLRRSVSYLMQHVNRNYQVPPWENPDAGIRTPFSCVTSPYVKRLGNKEGGIGLNYCGSFLYKKWVARPKRVDVESDEFSNSELSRNSAAKLIAAVRGTLRGGYLTFRIYGQVPYGSKRGVAPCWDYIPRWSDLNSIGYRWLTESVGYF